MAVGSRRKHETTLLLVEGEPRLLARIRDLTAQQRLEAEMVAAQKMEVAGRLAPGVAHELSNPLAAIVGFSQLIRGDPSLPEDLRHNAELLAAEAERTQDIAGNLLDFLTHRPPERRSTSIRALIDSVLTLQASSLGAGTIEVEVDVPDDLPPVELDRGQLQQVLVNLTRNAIEAVGARRGSKDRGQRGSRGATRPRRAGPDHRRGRRAWRPTRARRPAVRGVLHHQAARRRQRARPVGVAGDRAIARRRPAVRAISLGTRRRVHVRPAGPGRLERGRRRLAGLGARRRRRDDRPARARCRGVAASPAAGSAGAAPTVARGGRVLVLDDDPTFRAFLEKALAALGYEPVIAARGQEAVDLARDGDPAAILCDHQMVGMSGIEVYEAVVGNRPDLATRFVMMSGDVLDPALEAFAATHEMTRLAKPFDLATLDHTLRGVMSDGGQSRG